MCDPHDLFRRGLVVRLEDDGIEVVAEATTPDEAVAEAVALAPDVVVVDVSAPGGADLVARLSSVVPTTRLIALSATGDPDEALAAVRHGAVGCLVKEATFSSIAAAVRAAVRGHTLLSPEVAGRLVEEYTRLSSRGRGTGVPPLTGLETDILTRLSRGWTDEQVAEALGLPEHTVRNQVRNVLGKLQLHTRAEAVLYALRERLIDP